MSVIHIAVACHKPSKLPTNNLLVPVQVNSVNAKRRMNMAHDDEGDNISHKNPNYCELTAQYWEWKNVKADYYGLCHYRRFLCFSDPQNAKRNERNHIVAEALDDINIKRFGLENEPEMRKVIEQNDAVVGEYEQIRKLFTPRGNQTTTYKHWVAHDRALIRTQDLNRMLELLDEVAPEIGKDAREYLNKDVFTGFNCFVLKKDLFDELCSIEFKVLELLEKEIDLANYCTQLSRIYGFMGEIISSSYIYHLEKTGKYRVKHVPLLYFNYTDQPASLTLDDNAIPIVFYFDHIHPEAFGTIWQSFLENANSNSKYDVVLVGKGVSLDLKNAFSEIAQNCSNVKLRFLDADMYEKIVNEHFRPSDGSKLRSLDPMPLLPFLPFYLSDIHSALVFTKNILFADKVDELWNTSINNDCVIAAAPDSLTIARVNDIYPETKFNYLKEVLKNPYDYYSVASMKIDFDKYRNSYTQNEIAEKCWDWFGRIRIDEEIVNVLFEGKIQRLPQRWNTWYESNDYLKYQLPYLPVKNLDEQIMARENPAVISYQPNDPWEVTLNPITSLYWRTAKKTVFYELYLEYRAEYQIKKRKSNIKVTEKFVPRGSEARGKISLMFPKGSMRYRVIKKLLDMFHME